GERMPLNNSSHRISFALILIAASVCLSACGRSGSAGLHIKSAATGEKDVAVKSSYSFAVTKTFTDASGKMSTAASYRTYSANYDLDSANFAMTMDKPLTSDDQARVVFSLVGDEG